MASGFREIVFNTQERLISPDLNRAQKFVSADVAELFRYMLDVTANDDLDAGAIIAQPNSVEAPLRAEIVNGFLVRPDVGSITIRVDAGVAFCLAPDGAADESPYKYVRFDPGTTPAVLSMTANASGSTRIDVVEMQVGGSQVVSDSRDVFNSSTGFFTAALVTKERRAGVVFRVRTGTPGSGFPGSVAGWLPLAVMSVPNGATTNDAVTFWDVRPVIADRQFGSAALSTTFGPSPEVNAFVDFATGPICTMVGQALAFANGRRLGGALRRGTPGTDGDSIVITDSANLDPSYTTSGQGMAYVYLLTPFGLPRWARYTDSGSGVRQPRSPRGIPVVSRTAPLPSGKPSAAITLPTSCGFVGGQTDDGACIAPFVMKVGGGSYNHSYNGRVVHVETMAGANSIGSTVPTGTVNVFTIVFGTHVPANAKRIYCSMQFTRNAAANNYAEDDTTWTIYKGSYGASAPNVKVAGERWSTTNPTAGTLGFTRRQAPVWLPVPQFYPGAQPSSFDVAQSFAVPAVGPFLTIHAYEV